MGNCLTQAVNTVQEISEAIQEQENNNNNNNNSSQQQQQQQGTPATSSGGGGYSPIHSSLPAGAEKYRVRNVYDGDTLTLIDERRVRFLGIDTPEIKEKQPFAEEAKEYTKSRCHKQDIWISYDGDRQDHYGRLLAFVWVQEGGGYLNVNEGIVAAGLASVYAPNAQSKTSNYDKLIELQKEAKRQGKGMWANFENRRVVKTANGAAYHIRSCEHLSTVRHLEEMDESDAMDRGLHACRTCLS